MRTIHTIVICCLAICSIALGDAQQKSPLIEMPSVFQQLSLKENISVCVETVQRITTSVTAVDGNPKVSNSTFSLSDEVYRAIDSERLATKQYRDVIAQSFPSHTSLVSKDGSVHHFIEIFLDKSDAWPLNWRLNQTLKNPITLKELSDFLKLNAAFNGGLEIFGQPDDTVTFNANMKNCRVREIIDQLISQQQVPTVVYASGVGGKDELTSSSTPIRWVLHQPNTTNLQN